MSSDVWGAGTAAANPDRAYCVAALDALERLEANSRRRNEARREHERKLARRRTFWSALIACVLPLVILGYFVVAQSGILKPEDTYDGVGPVLTRGVALLAVTVLLFLIVYLACNAAWNTRLFRPLRESDERRLRAEYVREREEIDARAEAILAEPVFTEGRIPPRFLATNLVAILVRLFDSGQATFLKAAVYMLDHEIKNTAYYSNIVPPTTLPERERERIAEDREEVTSRG